MLVLVLVLVQGVTLNSSDVASGAESQHLALELVVGRKTEEPKKERSASRGPVPCLLSIPGPLENTYRDFWLMVWEQKVLVIVMTTR